MITWEIGITVFSLFIGAVASYIITRWSMKRQKIEGQETSIRDAANQIMGSANNIIRIQDIVSEHGTILNDILSILEERKENGGLQNILNEILISLKDRNEHENTPIPSAPLHNLLSRNPQLDVRIRSNMVEKKLVGKYILPHISTDSCLAIDCGTNAAWAFHEIAEIHKNYLNDGSIKVMTNNIFIPLIFSQDYDSNNNDDIWCVEEMPSSCYITSGSYFPSYGAILNIGDDVINIYKTTWQEHKPNIILIGCTSFDAENGPYCRSEANRNFKNSLIRYGIENTNVKIFILLDLDKIGKRLGVACDVSLWNEMATRENVYILSGFSGNKAGFAQLQSATKATIHEEVKKMITQERKNKFYIIDENANSIDLIGFFNSQSPPAKAGKKRKK